MCKADWVCRRQGRLPRQDGEAFLRKRWAQDVAQEAVSSVVVEGTRVGLGVQVETAVLHDQVANDLRPASRGDGYGLALGGARGRQPRNGGCRQLRQHRVPCREVISSILATLRWTHNPETLSALEGTAKQLGHDRPDILVIAGGDGTVHETMSKVLLDHEPSQAAPIPHILIISIGTMNNLATTLGLTKHPAVKLAKLIAAKIRDKRPLDLTPLNPLKINDEFGFLYGTGLPVNFG